MDFNWLRAAPDLHTDTHLIHIYYQTSAFGLCFLCISDALFSCLVSISDHEHYIFIDIQFMLRWSQSYFIYFKDQIIGRFPVKLLKFMLNMYIECLVESDLKRTRPGPKPHPQPP